MVGEQLPRTRAEYKQARWTQRLWWGIRPHALPRARRAEVDADVEAAIRNYAQLSRAVGLGALLTLALTLINWLILRNRFDVQATWSAFLLTMSQVGSFFALRRSNETRAYLGEIRLALHELSARSVLMASFAYPRELEECQTATQLRLRATNILRHLLESHLFPRSVDSFSVWVRDDRVEQWRIFAAIGTAQRTITSFTQPILKAEMEGAGIVANLAVTGTPSYYQAPPPPRIRGSS